MSLLEDLESLRIPFTDIKEATKHFTTRIIGKGGYGLVYKGELLLSGKLTPVAVKRLQANFDSGQGLKEFLTEIQLLTRYKHPNLISLIGFCYEGEEKILIYEYAEHGSLDKYLSTVENRRALTWERRLNICVNAARGLKYLHYEASTNERVIHRDIKSANILLDQNWNAMISDLGLSKLGRANEKDTYLITIASGTYVYCDPVYTKSGILTKESDVYSFGVVLFEVLCGRLCVIDVHNEHRFLPQLAQTYYKKGQINEIMDVELQNQVDSDSLKKFSEIAFKCIHNTRKQRPSMRWVLKKLEEIQSEMNPMLNPRAAGPEVSLIGIPGSNQGSNNSTLKGWSLTGLDQLRSGLKQQQKYSMRASQPFHQPQMLSPKEQLLLLAQQNMTSQLSNDESRRLRMLLDNRSMSMDKDGLSSTVGDIPNVGSQMGVLPPGDLDMLHKPSVPINNVHEGYWKPEGQNFQHYHVSSTQSNFQNPSELNPVLISSYNQQKPEVPQQQSVQYSASQAVAQSYQPALPPPPPTSAPFDTVRVSQMQIPTNPRISSNLHMGLPKNNNATTGVTKPAYISVSLPKSNDNASSHAAADSSVKPGILPPSLGGYVERALYRCKDDRQMAACQDILKEVITKASNDGTLTTRDWDTEPRFALPDSNVINNNTMNSSTPPSIMKSRRSPTRRTKSRWEPLPEEKSVEKQASFTPDSFKYSGSSHNNERDKQSLELWT